MNNFFYKGFFFWTFIYPSPSDELEHDDGGFQETREDDGAEPAEDGGEAERDDQDPGGEPGEGEGEGGAGGQGGRAEEAERGEGGGVGEAETRDLGTRTLLPRECTSSSASSDGGMGQFFNGRTRSTTPERGQKA